MDEEQVEKITKKLLSYECVEGIHDLVIHNYGVHNDFVTVHVEIDSKMDIMKAHDLMDNIEKDFREEQDIELTIHMDPIIVGDEYVDKLQEKVIQAIRELDKELKVHDFRVVKGITHTNILFDCIVPYEKDYTEESLNEHLRKTIIPEKEIYYYVIHIDRPYC